MWESVVVGLKPGTEWDVLLDLARHVVRDGGRIGVAAFVLAGAEGEELHRLEQAQRALDEVADELRGQGYEVALHADFVAMSPGVRLVELATETAAHAIVIGLTKRTRVGKALVGSDAQRVLLEASIPVVAQRIA